MCVFCREAENFRLWGGQVHPYHIPIEQKIDGHRYADIIDTDAGKLTEHSILDGPSWLMRWDTWGAVGPLDRTTAAGACRSEEYPWCEKLKAQGGRIGVIQPHCVVHTGLTQTDGASAPGAAEEN